MNLLNRLTLIRFFCLLFVFLLPFISSTAQVAEQLAEVDSMVKEPSILLVDLTISNEIGETCYTRLQESFWAMSDTYRLNLEYLINQS